jgi:hypothetical protein
MIANVVASYDFVQFRLQMLKEYCFMFIRSVVWLFLKERIMVDGYLFSSYHRHLSGFARFHS